MILLAPIIFQAAAFAPPEMPLRIASERIQIDANGETRFRLTRLVRFARDGIGWRAEVRVLDTEATPSAEASAMFDAGYSGLIGRTLVFRLDGAGNIISLDDQAEMWAAFTGGIGRIFAARKRESEAERKLLAERIAAPLAAIPAARQLQMLGSLADAAIVRDALTPHAPRPIRLPAASPYGSKLTLEGTRTIARNGALVRITTTASSAEVETSNQRDADPATGLLTASVEAVTSRVAGQSLTRTSTTRVERAAAEDWTR